jgi:hypothetical protein
MYAKESDSHFCKIIALRRYNILIVAVKLAIFQLLWKSGELFQNNIVWKLHWNLSNKRVIRRTSWPQQTLLLFCLSFSMLKNPYALYPYLVVRAAAVKTQKKSVPVKRKNIGRQSEPSTNIGPTITDFFL